MKFNLKAFIQGGRLAAPVKEITLSEKRKVVFQVLDVIKQTDDGGKVNTAFSKIDPMGYTDGQISSIYSELLALSKDMKNMESQALTQAGWVKSASDKTTVIYKKAGSNQTLTINLKDKTFTIMDGSTIMEGPTPKEKLIPYLTKPVTLTTGSL